MAGHSPTQHTRIPCPARPLSLIQFHVVHGKRADREAEQFASIIASFPAAPSWSMLEPGTNITNDDEDSQSHNQCTVPRSNTMGMERLIPLILGSSASLVPSARYSSVTKTKSSRSSSVGAESTPVILLPILAQSPTLGDPNPIAPLMPEAMLSKSDQRLPAPPRPKLLTDLIIMPTTRREWRSALDEVRRLYLMRQYKQCSARCAHLLGAIEDPYRIHPLCLIYLYFYAATCIELTARSMHSNASEKIPLLQQSLEYYEKAHSHMAYATFSADPTLMTATQDRRLISQNVSDSSSARSSIDSVFSQVSTASSNAPPSPASSISSSGKEDKLAPISTCWKQPQTSKSASGSKQAPIKVKKSVSFSLPSDLSQTTKISETPSTPKDSVISRDYSVESTNATFASVSSLSAHLLSPSHTRYMQHLTSLSTQLHYHLCSVRELIRSIQTARKARRSNTPQIFHEFSRTTGVIGRGSVLEEANEERRKDLQQRRERLKEKGWRKERFCAEKYQELCQRAMAELDTACPD